jgi:hypothetical protein
MNKLQLEAVNTTSTISAMRIAFLWIIKTIIFISIVTIIAIIAFTYFEKPFNYLGGIVGLITALGVVAFGGKAVQSFSEKTPVTNSVDLTTGSAVQSLIQKIAKTEEIQK